MNVRKKISIRNQNNNGEYGITLIALVITIILLIILSGITIYAIVEKGSIIDIAQLAKENTNVAMATETIRLKLIGIKTETYRNKDRSPTLQEIANGLVVDNEIEYVVKKQEEIEDLGQVEVGNATSIYTKLKEYPYEFEINGRGEIISIDGVDKTVPTINPEQPTPSVGQPTQAEVKNVANLGGTLYPIWSDLNALFDGDPESYIVWEDYSGTIQINFEENQSISNAKIWTRANPPSSYILIIEGLIDDNWVKLAELSGYLEYHEGISTCLDISFEEKTYESIKLNISTPNSWSSFGEIEFY